MTVARISETLIRQARAGEANMLTELALRSKTHWGYDEQFIKGCRNELTITQKQISDGNCFVMVQQGRIAGFYNLTPRSEEEVELEHLFIELEFIGQGFGKMLWRHATGEARKLGFSRMQVLSDPYAEEFYLAMGAKRVGEVISSIRQGRMLPLMSFEL